MIFSESLAKIGGTTFIKFRKISPQIMTVAGGIAVIAGTVMACRTTLKIDDIIDKHVETIQKIKDGKNRFTNEEYVEYTEEDYKKDLAITYTRTAVDLVKRYAPSAITVFAGIGLMVGGNYILGGRLAAISAAYAACRDEFSLYRKNVRDRFGENVENEIHNGLRIEKLTEKTTDENGEESDETFENVTTYFSKYGKFFDKNSQYWSRSAMDNAMFLKCKEQQCNDMLHARGYLFLREVYEMLDVMPHDDSGVHNRKHNPDPSSIIGWVTSNDGSTNNFVSFGIDDYANLAKSDNLRGYNEGVYLTFNIDGVIWDLI